ncbi:peptidase [Brevibacterium sp. 5221]|uniref:Peptidase n=1 Tax=Brevibacterium rongguiense TaxID=2695267 RepID=A0A6N9H4X3_9MICO|nr:peptidase [Brevibacterium rongguiense]MYM19108.1 peptidase [Brevibacterium rongguiense]
MTIDWYAFLVVFVVALVGAGVLVTLYALGLRLLVAAGRPPVVPPAEFPDAITVLTPKQAAKAEKKAAKAAKKVALSPAQQTLVLALAYACFGLCGACVLAAVALLVFG